MGFAENLKALRQEKMLTQKEVAESAGINIRSYIDYETGNSKPRYKSTYEKLAKALGCNIEDLVKREIGITVPAATAAAIATGVVSS